MFPLLCNNITRVSYALIFLGITCGSLKAETGPSAKHVPQRVISIDYCADQYLLKLGTSSQILGVSPKSVASFSFMREKAKNFNKVRPTTEELLALKPDLIIRSFGGGIGINKFLSDHKIPIIQIGFLDSLEDINQTITNVSKALGNDELGIALVEDLNRRLLAVPNIKTKSSALYMAAGGVTTGKGTLVHDIMSKGNLRNIVDTPGWSDIPLEQLVSLRPDIIVHSYLGDLTKNSGKWSAVHHPVTKRFLESNTAIAIPPALVSCGAWYSLDAVEMISRVQREYTIH